MRPFRLATQTCPRPRSASRTPPPNDLISPVSVRFPRFSRVRGQVFGENRAVLIRHVSLTHGV